jgi:hypothetical protein
MTALRKRFGGQTSLNHRTDWEFTLGDCFRYCLFQGALWDIQGPVRESTAVISRQNELSWPLMGPRRPLVSTYPLTDWLHCSLRTGWRTRSATQHKRSAHVISSKLEWRYFFSEERGRGLRTRRLTWVTEVISASLCYFTIQRSEVGRKGTKSRLIFVRLLILSFVRCVPRYHLRNGTPIHFIPSHI